MKRRKLLLGLSFALLLQGCSPALLEREYMTERVHVESSYLTDSSVLRADSYTALVEDLLQLVSQGTEHGIIRLFNYAGDVRADLARACLEVKRDRPLGAYAVDYMTHEVSRIVSYDEVHVYITYRRSHEQVKSIVAATGRNAVRQVLQDTLSRFEPSAVLLVSDLEAEASDIQSFLQEVYDALPGNAFGLPECRVSLYPSEGTSERIVEIELTYREKQESLLQKQTQVEQAASGLVSRGRAVFGKELLTRLYQELCRQTAYKADGGDTVYDALIKGEANSEGIAMAMALLCQRAGLPCSVVRGTRNGSPWVWNRVTLGEEVVELDVSADSMAHAEELRYVPAGEMGSAYAYAPAALPDAAS